MALVKVARCVTALAFILLLAGCDEFLTVEPTEEVSPGVAMGSLSGLESLLAGVYNRKQSANLYGRTMFLLPDIMADNTRPSDPPQHFHGQYLNEHGSHMGSWSNRYNVINEANFVIQGAEQLEDAPESSLNRIKGEALFLRGLAYFDLARIFGYEPGRVVGDWDRSAIIRTEPTESAEQADFRPRSSNVETYQQAESDLLEALSLLSANGSDDVFFANQAATEALLARLYLYWERWEDAADYATRALDNTPAQLASPDQVPGMFDQAPNPEALWEINYDPATESLWVNVCMGCYTQPDGTWFSIWPSDELLDLFEPDDVRAQHYPETTGQHQPEGIPFNNKWTESQGDNTDNKPVIRYAEVLLIRAEAYAEMGQSGPALQDLNRLREHRGLESITVGGEELIQEILDERRRELGFEGHRWFDLKRRAMDIPKPAHSGLPPLPYTDYRILGSLPNSQVENNPELEQNPGY